jgi:hypothetical protein
MLIPGWGERRIIVCERTITVRKSYITIYS